MNIFRVFAVACLALLTLGTLPSDDPMLANAETFQCITPASEPPPRVLITPGFFGPELLSSIAENHHYIPKPPGQQCRLESVNPTTFQQQVQGPVKPSAYFESKKAKGAKVSKLKKKKKSKDKVAASSRFLMMTSLHLQTHEMGRYQYAMSKINGSLMLPVLVPRTVTRSMCFAHPPPSPFSLMLHNPQSSSVNISVALDGGNPLMCAVKRLVLDECGFTFILPSNTTAELHLRYTPNYSQPIESHDIFVTDKAGVRSVYKLSSVLPYEVTTQCKRLREAKALKEREKREKKESITEQGISIMLLVSQGGLNTWMMTAVAVALTLVIGDILSHGALHTACSNLISSCARRLGHRTPKKRMRYKLPKVNLSAQASLSRSSSETDTSANSSIICNNSNNSNGNDDGSSGTSSNDNVEMQATEKTSENRTLASNVAKVRPRLSSRKSHPVSNQDTSTSLSSRKSNNGRNSHSKAKHNYVSNDTIPNNTEPAPATGDASEGCFDRRKRSLSRKTGSISKLQTAVVSPVYVAPAPSKREAITQTDAEIVSLSAPRKGFGLKSPDPATRDNSFDSMYSPSDLQSLFDAEDESVLDDDSVHMVNDTYIGALIFPRSSTTSTDSGCMVDLETVDHVKKDWVPNPMHTGVDNSGSNSSIISSLCTDGSGKVRSMSMELCSTSTLPSRDLRKTISAPYNGGQPQHQTSPWVCPVEDICHETPSLVLPLALDGLLEQTKNVLDDPTMMLAFTSKCADDLIAKETKSDNTSKDLREEPQKKEVSFGGEDKSPIRSVNETVDMALSKTLESCEWKRTRSSPLPITSSFSNFNDADGHTTPNNINNNEIGGSQQQYHTPLLPSPESYQTWKQSQECQGQQSRQPRDQQPLFLDENSSVSVSRQVRQPRDRLSPFLDENSSISVSRHHTTTSIRAPRLSPLTVPKSTNLSQMAVDPFADVKDARRSESCPPQQQHKPQQRQPHLPPPWRPEGRSAASLMNVQYIPCMPLQPPASGHIMPIPSNTARWLRAPVCPVPANTTSASADGPRGLIPMIPSFAAAGMVPPMSMPTASRTPTSIPYPRRVPVPLPMQAANPTLCNPVAIPPPLQLATAVANNVPVRHVRSGGISSASSKSASSSPANTVPQKTRRPVDIVQDKVDKVVEVQRNPIESTMGLWNTETRSDESAFPSSLCSMPGNLASSGAQPRNRADSEECDGNKPFADTFVNGSYGNGEVYDDDDAEDLLRMCFDSISRTSK